MSTLWILRYIIETLSIKDVRGPELKGVKEKGV